MPFALPELPYAYDALAPFMSRETLEFHHDKHHLAYVNNGNNLMKGTAFEGRPVEDVVKSSFFGNPGLFNNAGQHYNHIHFWNWMKPKGGGDRIPGKLEKQIVADLGSVAKMKEDFVQAGVTQFGSGWCWLAVKYGRIEVMKTPNGENPLVHGATPILGCDVWEHSYYIDYRNRRPDYLKAFPDHLVIGIMWPSCSRPPPNNRIRAVGPGEKTIWSSSVTSTSVSGSGWLSGGVRPSRPLSSSSSLMRSVVTSVSSASTPVPARRSAESLGLGLVDFDVFLQRMDEFLLEVLGRNRRLRDFAQRHDRIFVVIALDRDLARRTRSCGRGGSRAERDRSGFPPCRCNLRR